MREVTCKSEGVYRGALIIGRTYTVIEYDEEKRQYRVQGANGRKRWFPAYCFVEWRVDIPLLAHYTIDDPLESQTVEVTITLSDGSKRWCSFSRPEDLADFTDSLDSGADLVYGFTQLAVLKPITRESIAEALRRIESQGDLIRCTLPIKLDE